MTTAQVVETSVTVNNNSPIQDYVHPDDQTQPTFNIYIYTVKDKLPGVADDIFQSLVYLFFVDLSAFLLFLTLKNPGIKTLYFLQK